jgi:hypothetical protein
MIDFLGGRKNVLGYLFLLCTTFLIWGMLQSPHLPDYFGMASVIAAMAAGVGTLVWGNVKEHQSANGIKPNAPQP